MISMFFTTKDLNSLPRENDWLVQYIFVLPRMLIRNISSKFAVIGTNQGAKNRNKNIY